MAGRLSRRCFAVFTAATIGAVVVAGQTGARVERGEDMGEDVHGKAALLFSYEIDRGRAGDFEAGYNAHLGWHAEHEDHLVWYGWYVISGARVGAFVDGAFGDAFEAIDRRPALAEDGKHFAEYVAPFARPLVYSVHELWATPSTAFTLEDRQPTLFLDVYTVKVAPGDVADFERALVALSQGRADDAAPITWYRASLGTGLPSYLAMVPRRSWAELGERSAGFEGALRHAYAAKAGDIENVTRSIEALDSEAWAYRRDLSYFPNDEQ